MSNFSTFFPAGGGGEGAGINSYAPFKVTQGTGNPVGYNATTGLYTNPVDDSVWLKTGKQVLETSPRTYPNAATFEDMFIAGGVPVLVTGAYANTKGLMWQTWDVAGVPTDYIYNGRANTLYQTTYNPASGGSYTTIYTSAASGSQPAPWDYFTYHENSTKWYDRGPNYSKIIVMPSYSSGGPNSSNITQTYDAEPDLGQYRTIRPLFTIGNLLYVTAQNGSGVGPNDLESIFEFALNPTTGLITGYTGNTWNLATTLGNGNVKDMDYDPISQFVYFQGETAGTDIIQLNPTTFAATGAYQTVQNTANTTVESVDRFAFGKIGATNVLFIQAPYNYTTAALSHVVGQFYSQASDFVSKVGDSTVKTDASGSAQPLFIKLK